MDQYIETAENQIQRGYNILGEYLSTINNYLTREQAEDLQYAMENNVPENTELDVEVPTPEDFQRYFRKEISRLKQMNDNIKQWIQLHRHEINPYVLEH